MEDPYFMCHLLALAQLQERELSLPQSVTYTSRLLVTHLTEREYMLLYEAEITTELLSALKNPKASTTPVEWPKIRRKKLPFKPYDTFAGRLEAELVASTPSPLGDILNPPNDNEVILENNRKRSCDKEDVGSYKMGRVS